jgi:hypothetical protein
VNPVLLAWAGSPGRAESAQAAMILANREETPSCLTGGQDPPHVTQGLLPQIISLYMHSISRMRFFFSKGMNNNDIFRI